MRSINELVIRDPGGELASRLRKLDGSLAGGWGRDRALEERLRGTGLGGVYAFCFRCEEAPGRPAAALRLQARSAEEWYVFTIVPLGRRELSDEEYNRILGEFDAAVLEPLSRGSAARAEILPPRPRLEDFLSPEACRRLRAFSEAAHPPDVGPDDRSLWYGFLVQAHRDAAPLDPQTLEEWLAGQGWPQEQREELAREYEVGRALLAHYDEERGS